MILAQITGIGTVGKNQRKIHPVASRVQVNVCKVLLHTYVESVVSVSDCLQDRFPCFFTLPNFL